MKSNQNIFNDLKGLEYQIIQKFKRAFPLENETIIGNDSAFYKKWSEKSHLLITKDLLIEGTHFFPSIPYDALAYKSLVVNMSDILSDGGTPRAFIIGLGFPKDKSAYILQLIDSLCQWAKEFNVSIIGGDTVYSPIITISVTCVGETENTPWYRSRSKVGDTLYLTGKLGDSLKGLQKVLNSPDHFYDIYCEFVKRHLYPPFRSKEIKYLNKHYSKSIHAGTDISDGLFLDIQNILKESRVGADVFLDQIVGENLDHQKEIAQIIFSPEEYEVLFTSSKILTFPQSINILEIGKVTEQSNGLRWFYKKERISIEKEDNPLTFKHF